MLKQKLKNHLVRRRDEMYARELEEKSDFYGNWYRRKERRLSARLERTDHRDGKKLTCEVIRFSHLRNYIISGSRAMPDLIIACDDEGRLTDQAETVIRDYFAQNPDISLAYADEDRLDENGHLCDPWLKPDWSPDTFLSTFYFGSIFVFRSSELLMINPGLRKASDIEARSRIERDSQEETRAKKRDLDEAMQAWIYGKLCMKLAQAEGGFSRRAGGKFPIGHIHEILFHRTAPITPWDSRLIKGSLTGRYSSESARERLVSIIIPSKDNPGVLSDCLRSIQKYTSSSPYELIVVDNGSTAENQERVRSILASLDDSVSTDYIVQPMEFNFSKMCNLGAAHANGELLLFLNDDIEVSREQWLSYLSEKAKLPYVGAVGMKLLYPNSDVIQHAGVVNVHAGPIHKLQYCSNREVHYFGFNKGVRNVIAVTGACLMVRADLFHEAGGFDEENFAVAFNDVDLCLKIFRKGYYNVVRNNMYLYHHESLTRGDDRKDRIKSQRLSREQDTLLHRYPDLFRRDPFYHEDLVQDPAVTEFRIAPEDVELEEPHYETPAKRSRPIPDKWLDPVLRLGVEFANSTDRWLSGPVADDEHSTRGYYIKGYSFVIDADNAVYDRFILLQEEGNTSAPVYQVAVQNRYRPDIAENLTGQKNDLLTGFGTVIREKALPTGTYRVGMLANDRTSRQVLAIWSDVKLAVK